jgi:hypothetical protein
MKIPHFETKDQLFDYLRANKKLLYSEKKSQIKYADAISCVDIAPEQSELYGNKAMQPIDITNVDRMKVKIVINATNLLDSHLDVHIPGIWKKNLQESKERYHLQEHVMRFDHVITDSVKASTQTMTFGQLGFPEYQGTTEVLIFDSDIEKARNPYMAEQYAKGYVKQHSVGMMYVKYFMCINSESKYDQEEKANWDKYYPMIANKDKADDYGFFWAVTEAKCIEGSAVLFGSCHTTPTIEIEPANTTQPVTEPKQQETEEVEMKAYSPESLVTSLNSIKF